MFRLSSRRAALAALLFLSGACNEEEPTLPDAGTEEPGAGQPDSGTPEAGSGFAASGSLTPVAGKQSPTSARILVLWSASSTSTGYVYKFGEGASSGATFALNLPSPPPTEALDMEELGVGLLILVPTDFALADGKQENLTELETRALGAAGQFAIIYKAREDITYRSWAELFPVGYSCGRGVEAPPQGGFDSFEPVSCSSLGITVDDLYNIEFTNWT